MGDKAALLGVDEFLEPKPPNRAYLYHLGLVRVDGNAQAGLMLQGSAADVIFMEQSWDDLCDAEGGGG